MADDREVRQQELARFLLEKARQDLTLVRNVQDSKTVADEIVGFHMCSNLLRRHSRQY